MEYLWMQIEIDLQNNRISWKYCERKDT